MPDLTIEASDRTLRPDQYIVVETHAWWLGSFGPFQHLTEHLLRQWVPARPERDWLLDRELTGAQTWLTGSAAEAAAAGFDVRATGSASRLRAPYGDFDSTGLDSTGLDSTGLDSTDDTGSDESCPPPPPRPRRGSWRTPTSEFLARLPRDPDALRGRLREENPGSWFGPFAAAVTALRTCLVPADLRGALYRALGGLPSVTVTEGVHNVDGNRCLALVHDTGRTRTELMIDPCDGQFAGERDTLRADSSCGLRAGTVISSTAVRTAVVGALGELPAA